MGNKKSKGSVDKSSVNTGKRIAPQKLCIEADEAQYDSKSNRKDCDQESSSRRDDHETDKKQFENRNTDESSQEGTPRHAKSCQTLEVIEPRETAKYAKLGSFKKYYSFEVQKLREQCCSSSRVELKSSKDRLDRTKSLSIRKHPVTPYSREIISSSFQTRHMNIGETICHKLMKYVDFKPFIIQLQQSSEPSFADELRDFLDELVDAINDINAIERISINYGKRCAYLKYYGFKSGILVQLASAIFIEGVRRDMAIHQPTETALAWSQLMAAVFSSVRDGFHDAIRMNRTQSCTKYVTKFIQAENTSNFRRAKSLAAMVDSRHSMQRFERSKSTSRKTPIKFQ